MIAAIRPLSSTYTFSPEKTWNEHLQGAVRTKDISACCYAIEMGADVNATGEDGRTPLQTATTMKNLSACKILLDRGAAFTEQDQNNIESALHKKGVQEYETHRFFIQRPAFHVPQVMMPDGTFVNVVSLQESMRATQFTKPIAVFFIQNKEVNEYYGGVTQEFDTHAVSTFYQRIEPTFTVIRVLMNNQNRIIPLLDQIQECFPGLPISYFDLCGHGNSKTIQIGLQSYLTTKNVTIFEQIDLRLDPKAPVCVRGCECAKGPNNLVQRISCHSKHVILGSHEDVRSARANIIYPEPNFPALVLFHTSDMENFYVRAYQNGARIADGGYKDKSIHKKILKAINQTN